MNDIFYHITSASLSLNPFIHSLHTMHGCLRKTVDNGEDGGVVVGGGETSNKIKCNVLPEAVRYGEWL